MRIREKVVAAACLTVAACVLVPREAAAQVARNSDWGTVSDVSLVLGTSAVFLMPRVYYSDPESTVGWKARWHVSMLAPAMTMAVLTTLVEVPMKDAIESPRPGCTVDQTTAHVSSSNCETFGGPGTHAFASWGATGTGLGIFLVDTFRYSDGRFHAGGFIGDVAFPLTASVFTTLGRLVAPDQGNREVFGYEEPGQFIAGAIPGFLIGVGIGAAYGAFQRPNCGYGNALFCW